MKVILGIGNPGRKYAVTRHNAGWRVLERVAETAGVSRWRSRFGSRCAEAVIGGDKVFMVRPQTYVNESGAAAAAVLGYYRLDAPEMLVVADDAALPVGRIRFRRSGSSGGHRGLGSILRHVGEGFNRLRIGIGTPDRPAAGAGLVGHVLGACAGEDIDRAREVEDVAAAACVEWVVEGIDACMNRHNGSTIGSGGSGQ